MSEKIQSPTLKPPPLLKKGAEVFLSAQEIEFKKAIRYSTIGHCILFLAAIISSLTLTGKPKPYVPSVRVDIVGLPDIKKADLTKTQTGDIEKLKKTLSQIENEIKAEKQAEKVKNKKTEPLKSDPDAMSMKKKEARSKNLSDAISRIKSLQALEDEVEKTKAPAKGNKLSKGSQLFGEQTNDSDAYIDEIVSKIRQNWNLPLWLSRQNYSAKVAVYVDKRGQIAKIVFVKNSGNDQYDSYVKRAIEASGPFSAPPEDVLSDGIMLGFPL